MVQDRSPFDVNTTDTKKRVYIVIMELQWELC